MAIEKNGEIRPGLTPQVEDARRWGRDAVDRQKRADLITGAADRDLTKVGSDVVAGKRKRK